MREILFKAKRKDNNEWVYGCLVYDVNKKWYIHENNCALCIGFHEVIPETICQYTGLKDKNGVKIFENDDIEFSYDYFTGDFDTKVGKGIVKFIDGIFYIVPYEIENIKVKDIENEEWFPLYYVNLDEIEVKGNIFDEEVK